MSEKVSESGKQDPAETLYFCGLVFKSSLKEFEAVREYLLKFTDAKLIYQTKGVRYLQIVPEEGSKG